MHRPSSVFARRTLADGRTRTAAFGLLFAAMGFANALGYRHSYPTLEGRLELARTFGANKAVQLFYGRPYDLLTVGGYTAWRLAGFGCLLAAAWAVHATIRALRAEEDVGRQELVLAAGVSRLGAYGAALAAITAAGLVLWAATFVSLVSSRLPPGGSAFLALATVSPAAVFTGVGVLASQLASSRRVALQLSYAVLGASFLLRVVADIAGGVGWLQWVTPLGWTEQLRPFSHPHPEALILPAVATVALLALGGRIALGRDVGVGLLRPRDSSPPRTYLLSSPVAQALRDELGNLGGWVAGIGTFALIVGILSTAFTPASISASLRRELRKIGGVSIVTPSGAIGFYFVFFVLVISLFACSQIASARREESEQRLETLLAVSVGRTRWLAGRLLLACAGAGGLALVAAVLAWIGAAAEHAGVGFPRMIEAGANCLPATFLFLGAGALIYGIAPRATSEGAYGLVVLAFVWQLLGSLLGAPKWLLDATPFAHVAAVPAQPFRLTAAALMIAIGVAASTCGLAAFRRRDLTAS